MDRCDKLATIEVTGGGTIYAANRIKVCYFA